MPKYNIDEQSQISEPIEITLEGKTYEVKKVSTTTLKEITEMSKSKDLDAPIKQLAYLLGVDSDELKDVDLRKIGKALEFITTSINEGINQPKNSRGPATL